MIGSAPLSRAHPKRGEVHVRAQGEGPFSVKPVSQVPWRSSSSPAVKSAILHVVAREFGQHLVIRSGYQRLQVQECVQGLANLRCEERHYDLKTLSDKDRRELSRIQQILDQVEGSFHTLEGSPLQGQFEVLQTFRKDLMALSGIPYENQRASYFSSKLRDLEPEALEAFLAKTRFEHFYPLATATHGQKGGFYSFDVGESRKTLIEIKLFPDQGRGVLTDAKNRTYSLSSKDIPLLDALALREQARMSLGHLLELDQNPEYQAFEFTKGNIDRLLQDPKKRV